MFLMIFGTKIYFGERNLIFESLPGHQNIKFRAVNNMVSTWWSKKRKNNDLCSYFSVPGRTIWGHLSIDLGSSCSEHFFSVCCGPYSVPNDLICFDQFSQFLRFHRFCDFAHFFIFFTIFQFLEIILPILVVLY